uniref:ShKT domain-containing protein n=1 Tax=Ditylum brightwellii TaxID=49249 RepID=A0A7S4S114_9STRA
MPSSEPSSVPSTMPSSMPSSKPSSVPSAMPSSVPSLDPSSMPSPTDRTDPSPISIDCIICDDEETTWMKNNTKDCSTFDYVINTFCNKSTYWNNNKFCRLSCYNAGNGYAGGCRAVSHA